MDVERRIQHLLRLKDSYSINCVIFEEQMQYYGIEEAQAYQLLSKYQANTLLHNDIHIARKSGEKHLKKRIKPNQIERNQR